jgi:hypothetical protein
MMLNKQSLRRTRCRYPMGKAIHGKRKCGHEYSYGHVGKDKESLVIR